MLTRRQLLVSAGLLGSASVSLAAALPLPRAAIGRNGLQLGLLQSAQPFIDTQDLAGSRQRAFTAFSLLLQRSADQHPQLDWLAAGALPLSGPGPFPPAVLAQLALDSHSAELAWLADFAGERRLRLTLGTWWRDSATVIKPKASNIASSALPLPVSPTPGLLLFEPDGGWQLLPASAAQQLGAEAGLQLHASARWRSDAEQLASRCARLGLFGARIEPACTPAPPPGAHAFNGGATALYAPDGRLIAHADSRGETCVLGQLST